MQEKVILVDEADNALKLLAANQEQVPAPDRERAQAVLAQRERLLQRIESYAGQTPRGLKIRIHGDYHLGQVLLAQNDFVIIDFEGEPARPLAERRGKSSPLRDVAGMLRSLAYAAETARSRGTDPPTGWEHEARSAFLSGYASAIDPALLPASAGERERLLTACELEKALYELRYELDNRPDWVHVPIAGILRLLA